MAVVAILDDDPEVRVSLKTLLNSRFEVWDYEDPNSLIQALEQETPIGCILSDQRLPGPIQGHDVLQIAFEKKPEITRILLTAYSDWDSVIQAINKAHIYRYIQKPWDPQDLILTVTEAMTKFELIQQRKRWEKAKSDLLIILNHELKTPLTQIQNVQDLLSQAPEFESLKLIQKSLSASYQRLQLLWEKTHWLVTLEKDDPNPKTWFETEWPLSSWRNFKPLPSELPQPLKILGHPELWHLLWQELLDNAINYGDGSLYGSKNPTPNGELQLTLSNNIKTPIYANLPSGDPMEIAHPVETHKKGIGLGLTLAVRICQKLNWKIDWKIQGSNFIVTVTVPKDHWLLP